MRRVVLFAEDYGHEEFIRSLVTRLARESGIEIEFVSRSVRGGHATTIAEFKKFLDDLERDKEAPQDLLIVATDANCSRYAKRKKEVDGASSSYQGFILSAIPDPHIERWLLIDSSAFKAVLGKGCHAPDQKCDRDRYKDLLRQAMKNAGIIPPLGGLEYTEDLVNAMDLEHVEQADPSLGRFLKELRNKMKQWASE
jgi:hypothetical protein